MTRKSSTMQLARGDQTRSGPPNVTKLHTFYVLEQLSLKRKKPKASDMDYFRPTAPLSFDEPFTRYVCAAHSMHGHAYPIEKHRLPSNSASF